MGASFFIPCIQWTVRIVIFPLVHCIVTSHLVGMPVTSFAVVGLHTHIVLITSSCIITRHLVGMHITHVCHCMVFNGLVHIFPRGKLLLLRIQVMSILGKFLVLLMGMWCLLPCLYSSPNRTPSLALAWAQLGPANFVSGRARPRVAPTSQAWIHGLFFIPNSCWPCARSRSCGGG
jgi:hypothetical protein